LYPKKNKINPVFFQSSDVVVLARLLLGKVLCTRINGVISSGMIIETEAYNGVFDKASHSYGGRRTRRTEVMYQAGGVAYVYLCYGIHSLFNVITSVKNDPKAILVRAIAPMEGISIMEKRRGMPVTSKSFTDGPGKVSLALGINLNHNGIRLDGNSIWLEDRGLVVEENDLLITPRIGIDYAGEDAGLQYRFLFRQPS
jgi:DNA-3-methyladenine glycosylase